MGPPPRDLLSALGLNESRSSRDLPCLGTRSWMFSGELSMMLLRIHRPGTDGDRANPEQWSGVLSSESRAVAVAGADANH